jgi:stearoyl-CoA desaturase (delta-9 desaturase)
MGWFWASEENNAWPDQLREGRMPHIARWQRFPELVLIDNHDKVPPIILLAACFAFDGCNGLMWGFVIPTVGIWHAIFSLNSICHTWGERRFATSDNSRNVSWLTLPLLGGNWHNNHHAFHWSAREGLKWWEIDLAYLTLRGLEKIGVVWGLKVPSDKQVAKLEAKHTKDPATRIKNTVISAVIPKEFQRTPSISTE